MAPYPQEVYTGDDVGIAYPKDGSDLGTEQGASGKTSGAVQISRGGMIAIIVVVVAFTVIGVTTATLFYVAKKREWKVREGLRRSARKVVTALTPRRTEFPRDVKNASPNSRRRERMDDVPPTPRIRPEDLEKGLNAAKNKQARWGR
ncbi:Uncharacterized protein SAPIO_CDS9341 [Scedosporium apiospermum]|uniref:Transmembrane protein n=1 Tax=Pseudallescheria apiosperma TaxID=563466 RepID=A0A084FWL3_PSEDA|nr:Uncharacterized protein SAPIO_CDS9341 [Scedosporium apiospermum]KEZ39475.1 Uncharacterized protein SAPIO_CDS9341 [Scedosporium apiospermum]